MWDVATGREIGVLSGHRFAVRDVAFSPDDQRLVSGGEDGTIRVWDTASWQPMLGHSDTAFAGFFDDGRRIGSGSDDGTVRWWDAATLRPIGEPLRVNDPDVQTLFPVDEDRLVSLGSANTVRLWDARTRTPLGEPLRLPPDPGRVLEGDDQVRRIAAAIEPGTVRLWNTATMQPVGEPIKQDQPITVIKFSADGRIVATGGFDGLVRLWYADTGKPLGQPMKGNGTVTSIALSRDGHLLTAGYTDNTMRLWDTQAFKPVGDPMTVDSLVSVAAFSEDGRTVAAGSDDGSIQLWNVDDQARLGAVFKRHTDYVTSLDFSPDGTKLLSASADHTLQVLPVTRPSREAFREALCAKLTHNMSREMWNAVVSPKISYIKVCPDLPDAEWAG